jgi:hypothetical protein
LEVAAQSDNTPARTVSYGMSDADDTTPKLASGAPGSLSAPIMIRSTVFGTLRLSNKRPNSFDQHDLCTASQP